MLIIKDLRGIGPYNLEPEDVFELKVNDVVVMRKVITTLEYVSRCAYILIDYNPGYVIGDATLEQRLYDNGFCWEDT